MSHLAPASVLVVEDDRFLLEAIERLLRRDWTVVCAASGTEAIALLKQRRVDAVLCDVTLPDRHGLTVAEEVVGWEPSYVGRFIFMSSTMPSLADTERVALLGGHYELKPLDVDSVLRGLRKAVSLVRPSNDSLSTLSLRGPSSRPPSLTG